MKLTFCGAAKIVTGSCYLLEVGRDKILIDCGMFQGTKEITALNYRPFRFDPKAISHVILTHAHIDHCGLIPKLVKEGFGGAVIGTHATADLAAIMLEDSAHVQKQETEAENRRRLRMGMDPREPLYTEEDAREAINYLQGVAYGETVGVTDDVEIVFRDAGHILGSSICEVFVTENGRRTKIVFSGDIGQWDVPIVNDPTPVADADWLLIESTYGDRLHEQGKDRDTQLVERVEEAYKKGGRLLIPSFSVERTQEIIYSFYKSLKAGRFPDEKIFLDSPLAIKATEIFKKHRECFDAEAREVFTRTTQVPNLVYCPTAADSMKLNDYDKPCIIIAGSGMCNAGRIRHHLKHGLWNPKNTVLFVGYQGTGTLGRVILDGAKEVRMMGVSIVVQADVHKISGFSAHADYEGIMRWMGGFERKPRQTFVVHGEPHAADSLKARLAAAGFACHVPDLGEQATLG